MLAAPDAQKLSVLWRNRARIVDNVTYWQMVATCWIGFGRTARLATFRGLLASQRPMRWRLMKKADRRVWRALPGTVTAYRAHDDGEDLGEMISWTIDRAVAEKFAAAWEREVVTRQFPKRDVVAYFDRRGEREILVLRAGK